MKKIIDNCCGCGVCEAVCAKKSIALMPDEHGFYKAFLNNDTCVDCGLCVKVCPQRHSIPFISHSVSRHYVAQVADKMVLQYSSSGGVAYIIRKTKNSSFKNEKSKKEVDVAITVSNKDIV